MAMKKFDEAKKDLSEVVQHAPEYAESHLILGRLNSRDQNPNKDFISALNEFDAVLQASKYWNDPETARATARMVPEDLQIPLPDALKLEARQARGAIYLKLSNYSSAIEEFSQAIALGSSDVNLRVCRGYAKRAESPGILDKEMDLDIAKWILKRKLGTEDFEACKTLDQ